MTVTLRLHQVILLHEALFSTFFAQQILLKFFAGGASSAKTFEELLEQQLRLDEVSASCCTCFQSVCTSIVGM